MGKNIGKQFDGLCVAAYITAKFGIFMSTSLPERYALLRELFEQFGVPIAKLARVSKLSVDRIRRTAELARWSPAGSARALLDRAGRECAVHLEQLQSDDIDESKQEKRARALSVLAKTVETLVQVEERLDHSKGHRQSNEGKRLNEETAMDGNRSLQLYQELEKVLAGLETERETEKTGGNN